MSSVYLKFPSLEDKENVLDFKNEFKTCGENMIGDAGLNRIEEFEEWLLKVTADTNKDTCEKGRWPASLYLTYRLSDNKLVGMIQIRHILTEYLFNYGGHIGDCVRPSERGKGYGTEQIGLALEKCRELGMDKVLITCDSTNIASSKVIEKMYGSLQNEVYDSIDKKNYFKLLVLKNFSQIKQRES